MGLWDFGCVGDVGFEVEVLCVCACVCGREGERVRQTMIEDRKAGVIRMDTSNMASRADRVDVSTNIS